MLHRDGKRVVYRERLGLKAFRVRDYMRSFQVMVPVGVSSMLGAVLYQGTKFGL